MPDGTLDDRTHNEPPPLDATLDARNDSKEDVRTVLSAYGDNHEEAIVTFTKTRLVTHAHEYANVNAEDARGRDQSCQGGDGDARVATLDGCCRKQQHLICCPMPQRVKEMSAPMAACDEEVEAGKDGGVVGNGCSEVVLALSSDNENSRPRGNERSHCTVHATPDNMGTTLNATATTITSANGGGVSQWTNNASSQAEARDAVTARWMSTTAAGLTGTMGVPPVTTKQPSTRFARQVLHVIRHRSFAETTGVASQVGGDSFLTCSPHGSRHSTALPPSPRYGAADATDSVVKTAIAQADVTVAPSAAPPVFTRPLIDFDLVTFAPFFALAIREIVTECERRVANAPAALRAAQTRYLRGSHNYNLSVSSHSFDQTPTTTTVTSPHLPPPSPLPTTRTEGKATSAPHHHPYPSSLAAETITRRGDLPETADTLSFAHGIALHMPSGDTHGGAPPSSNGHPFSTVRRTGWSDEEGCIAKSRRVLAGDDALLCDCASPAHTRTSSDIGSDAARGGEGLATEVVCNLLKSLGQYLNYGGAAPMVFIAALAYLAGVTMRCASDYASVTWSNWYRLTTTAILVASKMYNEHGSRRLNAYFAQASGITLVELNRQELDFLYLVDFDLLLAERDVRGWLTWMERLALRHHMMTPLQHLLPQGITPTYSSCTPTSVCHTASLFTSTTGGEAQAMGRHAPRTTAHIGNDTDNNNCSSSGSTCDAAALPSWSGLPGSQRSSWLTAVNAECSVTASYVSHDYLPPPNAGCAGSCHTSPYVPSASQSILSANEASNLSTVLREPVPPSPIHGVTRHAYAKERLFSVIHGSDGPPSPRTVRQLARGALVTPLFRAAAARPAPPSPRSDSPPSFFRRDAAVSTTTMGQSRGGKVVMETLSTVPMSTYTTVATVTAAATRNGSAMTGNPGQDVKTGKAGTTSGAAAAMGESSSRDESVPSRQRRRWRPSFAVVQRVRDVLGVTASLVRGKLNVLATDEPAETLSPLPQNATRQPCSHTATAVQAKAVSATAGGTRDMRLDGKVSDEESEEEDEEEEGYYDEFGNYIYYDEEDIGYYDCEGQFHYFDDEDDGVDEEDAWPEEEGGQLGVTPPRRLPLTHSPPSL